MQDDVYFVPPIVSARGDPTPHAALVAASRRSSVWAMSPATSRASHNFSVGSAWLLRSAPNSIGAPAARCPVV